jgi:uncharacterized protein (TIGR02996 family)
MARKPRPTTGELLLRAVFDRPEDDAPRLAYADWLDDSGGEPERAALIRVQCELARLPADDPRADELRRREVKLLRGRKLKWRAGLPRWRGVVWGDFSRGFIDSVVLKSTYQFRRYSARIAVAIPLHTVTVKPAGAYHREMTGFGRMRALARVSVLRLAGQQIDHERLEQLLASPHLGRLSHLDVSDNRIGDAGIAHFVATSLPRLPLLNLRHNGVGLAGAARLAASPLAGQLECLDLSANGIAPSGEALLRAAMSDRVRL